MPNERLSRDDRFQAGRDRNEAEYRRGKSDRGNYPDWDRYGSYRDTERSRFGRDNGYVSDDRANWTTDDLGYSEFGDAGYRRTYADNSFDDRERGYARQYNFGIGMSAGSHGAISWSALAMKLPPGSATKMPHVGAARINFAEKARRATSALMNGFSTM